MYAPLDKLVEKNVAAELIGINEYDNGFSFYSIPKGKCLINQFVNTAAFFYYLA